MKWHVLACLVCCMGIPEASAQENPYCVESSEILIERFENRVRSANSLWEIKAVILEEARLMLDCFVTVRDQGRTRNQE